MADQKISELPLNSSINGTENVATERGGSNYKSSIDDIKTFILADVPASGVQTVNGDGVDNTDPENPVLSFPNTSEVTVTTDKNYVTDAEKTVIGNQSNTNTGDETTGTIQSKRPIKTVNGSSLEGSGDVVTPNTEYTDSEIKTKYENNADTNAFTDAEKSNLGSQSGVNTGDQDISGIGVNASAITTLQTDKADQSDLDLTNVQVLNNANAITPKIEATNYATFDTGGTVKMSRNTATSTTYISFDGSDTPNVT